MPPLLVPLFVFLEVVVLWVCQLPQSLRGEDVGGLLGPIVGVLLAVLSFSAFVASLFAVLTDPGYLPSGAELQELALRRGPKALAVLEALKDVYNEALPPSIAQTKGIADISKGILDIARTPPSEAKLGRGRLVEPRWCATCRIWRPPLASHCVVCRRCCMGFDHHCYIIGKCVGVRNHRSFFLLCMVGGAAASGILAFSLWQVTNRALSNGLWFREWWFAFAFFSLVLLVAVPLSFSSSTKQNVCPPWPTSGSSLSPRRRRQKADIVWWVSRIGIGGWSLCLLVLTAFTARQALAEPNVFAMLWSVLFCAAATPFCFHQGWNQFDAISRGSSIKGRAAASKAGEATPGRRASALRDFLCTPAPPLVLPDAAVLDDDGPARNFVYNTCGHSDDKGGVLLSEPEEIGSSDEEGDEEARPLRASLSLCSLGSSKKVGSPAGRELDTQSEVSTMTGGTHMCQGKVGSPDVLEFEAIQGVDEADDFVTETPYVQPASPRSLHSIHSNVSSQEALLGKSPAPKTLISPSPRHQYHVVDAPSAHRNVSRGWRPG